MSEAIPRQEPSAAEVASYLRRHPDFLLAHPDLALTLSIPRQNGPATSLAAYQLEVLREHNAELKRRLHELVQLAHENERLSLRVHAFALSLLRARSRGEALTRTVAALREDFATEAVRVALCELEAGGAEGDWLIHLPRTDPRFPLFHDTLERRAVICGRLRPEKLEVLFGSRSGEIRSAALLPLPAVGLLAIGSADPERFHPGIGTFFLERLAEIIAAALSRFESA